jgi:hypothetical protein
MKKKVITAVEKSATKKVPAVQAPVTSPATKKVAAKKPDMVALRAAAERGKVAAKAREAAKATAVVVEKPVAKKTVKKAEDVKGTLAAALKGVPASERLDVAKAHDAKEKAAVTADNRAIAKKKGSGFEKGTGLYKCNACTRETRSTGQGDNENVGLCAQCWEIAGIENQLLDGDYEGPAGKRKLQLEIQEYQAIVLAKGGKIAEEDLIVVDDAPVEVGAPDTPLTKLLTGKGFVYAKSEAVDEQNTAHGYAHPDGSAAMFVHANTSPNIGARWIVTRDGKKIEGKTAKELAVALLQPEPLPDNVRSALALLRKVTKASYRLADLAGDANYSTRLQLLKKLKGVEKVLVKDSGINNLVKALYEALGVEKASAAAMATAFETRCFENYRLEQRVDRAVVRVEKAEVKEQTKQSGGPVLIHDDKPVLPGVKKLSAAKQAIADEAAKANLALQIAEKRKREEYTPLAVPRPEASISVNLDDICVLEDPSNGISLLCLEKPNSQGAICVYNNGSRVAAGVVPTEVLITLRPLISEDLVRDVNQLLHPITAGVIVTPVAETHLTAVLMHCKEKIEMTTETAVKTKKFAAPANAAKKATAAKSNGKVEKATAAKATKVAKAPKEAKEPRAKVASNLDAVVTLAKKPGEGDKLAKRDKVIVEILTANGKKMSLKDLFKAMQKAIGGERTMESIWSWHGSPRQILVSGGFITVK